MGFPERADAPQWMYTCAWSGMICARDKLMRMAYDAKKHVA